MLERLKTVMSYYSLTPSILADSIGVPRSSISHLLTGRNKPSLDFVLKLIKTYPEINLYWLLNGKGTFPAKTEEPKQEAALPSPTIKKEPIMDVVADLPKSTTPVKLKNDSVKKAIKRIVFFFEDGSFETYGPN
ncbi:helix-turn-helix domain-containing protein [Croceivirga thetidis]|uniref:Helix-turn-helix transcriptional regulator n=1 Tax=Croceivirga thetidis TaxID=2721623 RepID=A0ABX1GT79_9FLAO|nr:helix-turn-helix transcriptional regulator [Croceivirga thetidis]NKI32215.1 helix-turn-helix transcriptional regulator [Croceivirga thetidis]